MVIYYVSPDISTPTGGIKQLYRHVDHLNSAGIESYILHTRDDFRIQWFENETPVAYRSEFRSGRSLLRGDILVLPEIFLMEEASRYPPGLKLLIFNQNAHYTFKHCDYRSCEGKMPYQNPNILALFSISEHNRDYLHFAFPDQAVIPVVNGIDSELFSFTEKKRKQIAFMPRKLPEQVNQVINLVKKRGAAKEWTFVPIEGRSEREVAETLKDSAIFLSFSSQEGLGLPPLEAACCGCLVIGYSGIAGREYFIDGLCYPIPQEDVLAYARTLDSLLDAYNTQPEPLREKARLFAEFIRTRHSIEAERKSVLDAWERVFALVL